MVSNTWIESTENKYQFDITITVFELIFLILLVFELGFLLGKQWQLNKIIERMMPNTKLSLTSNSQVNVQDQKNTSFSQESTAQQCLTMVAKKQNIDPKNLQTLFFQQKVPFNAPKRNMTANFQVIVEKKGTSLFKIQKYEQISEFDGSSSVASHQFNKLNQTMKAISQTQNQGDKNGIQMQLSKSQNSHKTSVMYKRLCFNQVQTKIQIEGLCQNGKLKALFQNIHKIGQGGFGSVFQATHKVQKGQYAIKKIYLKDLKKKDLLREVTIVNHLTHANIVRYYTWWIEQIIGLQRKQAETEYEIPSPQLRIKREPSQINTITMNSNQQNSIIFENSKSKKIIQPLVQPVIKSNLPVSFPFKRQSSPIYCLYIQMELYKGGTLLQYLKHKQRKSEVGTAFSIIKQLFKGLQFLHSHGVIHRDLKPANVFLDHKQKLIKIGDFGLSVFVNKQITRGQYMLSNRLGTPCYMAPELKQRLSILEPQLLDVYSLGVIYYELLKQFNSQHQRVSQLKNIQKGKIQLQNNPLQKQLIRMMTRNNKSRLSITKLKQTRQFKELNQKYGNIQWFNNKS